MEIFDLIVDEKVSVWRRSRIKVEAESLEEAVKNCVESGVEVASDFIDSEYLDETEEYIPQDKYSNLVTIEVMDDHYRTLATNEKC